MSGIKRAFSSVSWENSFVRELPGETRGMNVPRQVTGACYSRVMPSPVSAPELLAVVPEVLELLGLEVPSAELEQFTEVMAGNQLLPAMEPYATCYGGHQFGHWAGQLGDGRVLALGELRNLEGQRFEVQLKGAGPTPYSRGADGRAVLRSSLREFVCSEAMYHLGIPTTRALSLTATGEQVTRDMLYNGNPRREPGAVVCRVAPSFLRFGSYQLPAARREVALLRSLADYTLREYFPDLGPPGREAYGAWFLEVCKRTATLMVHFMRVGFVHGVLNTDNMSILGLTMDYGPYGWVEGFDPLFTPNTTDASGRRYCFGRQPAVAAWNLARLGEALLPLLGSPATVERALQQYVDSFEEGLRTTQLRKLGLETYVPDEDDALIEEVGEVMGLTEIDMTLFYRCLVDLEPSSGAGRQTESEDALIAPLRKAFYSDAIDAPSPIRTRICAFLRRYLLRTRREGLSPVARRARMNRENPKYVFRNYLAQQAIEQLQQGDNTLLRDLMTVLRQPYEEHPSFEHLAVRRPDWARERPGCSMLSCSS